MQKAQPETEPALPPNSDAKPETPRKKIRHGKEIIATYKAKVIATTDGDTIKVLNSDNEQIKIRLQSVDCPERKQPFGEKAKDFLAELVHKKTVNVLSTGEDRYRRTLAFITIDHQDELGREVPIDVCAEMVDGTKWLCVELQGIFKVC